MRLSMDEVRKQHDGIKKLYEQGLRGATASVEQVLDLFDTIEALQQENEQLRAQLDEWKYEVKCHMDEVIAREKQMARMRELLTKAYDEIEQTLAEIDKVIKPEKKKRREGKRM